MLKRFPEKIWLFFAALPLGATLLAAWIVLCEYVPAWQIAAWIAAGMFIAVNLAMLAAGFLAVRTRIRRS